MPNRHRSARRPCDGDLYVATSSANDIQRFDGKSGQFLDTFVAAGSGGLSGVGGMAFGDNGNLFVTSGSVLQYDGKTGAFINSFDTGGENVLQSPTGIVFRTQATPEPAGLTLLGLGAAVLAGRRMLPGRRAGRSRSDRV